MTTPVEGTGPVEDNGSIGGAITEPEAPAVNPAWNDVLNVLPEQFHPIVTPHFQRWDNSAQQRIEQANAQLKEWEAYQPLREHGISMEDVTNGLRYMQAINQDPRAVWQALGDAYGLTAEQAQQAVEGNEGEEDPYAAQFAELQNGLNVVAQHQLQQAEVKARAEAEAELDNQLAQIKSAIGDNYDEGYTLWLLNSDLSVEQAIAAHSDMVNRLLQQNPRPFAPNVMGANSGGGMGAGIPSQQIDPRTMTSNQSKQAVIAMLQAAQQQNQG